MSFLCTISSFFFYLFLPESGPFLLLLFQTPLTASTNFTHYISDILNLQQSPNMLRCSISTFVDPCAQNTSPVWWSTDYLLKISWMISSTGKLYLLRAIFETFTSTCNITMIYYNYPYMLNFLEDPLVWIFLRTTSGVFIFVS